MAPFKEILRQLVGEDFEKRRYLLAVSGGVDSMVLLHIAAESLRPRQIVVAHFHHGTRKTAERDLKLVERVTREIGAEFLSGRRPPTQGKVSELTLRNARREFLSQARAHTKCDYILTAHHLNDQFETLFMRLMRGTGAKGLSGIKAKNGRYLRPLLSLTKVDIQSYAESKGLDWFEDETNSDTRYLRNRVRQSVIPAFLRAAHDVGTESQILSRWNDTAKELSRLTKTNKRRITEALKRTPYWTRISEKAWERLDSQHQRAAIARVAKTPLTRPSLARVLAAMEKRQKRFDLTSGVEGVFSCGHWFFTTPFQRQRLKDGDRSFFEVTDPKYHARFFEPGDRIGKTKLKKLFLEAGIPKPERSLVPIIVDKSGKVVGFFPKSDVVRCDFPFSFTE